MYCMYCGKEINENAYVCLGCGALVKKKPKQVEIMSKDQNSVEHEREERKFKIGTGITIVLLIISTFLYLVGGGGGYYVSDINRKDLVVAGCVISIIALAVSTTILFWIIKEKNFSSKWTYIFIYIISAFLFLFGFFVTINL